MPQNKDAVLRSTRLVTNGRSVLRFVDNDRLESLDEFGQFAFAFGFGEEVAHVATAVHQQRKPVRYVRKTENKARRAVSAD